MGYFRFSLIIAVIYYHLAGKTIAGPAAVYGFFVLSGYVITLVANEIYNNGLKGKLYFLANRLARVYPVYLTCILVSVLCMHAVDFTTGLYQKEFLYPSSFTSWLVQFSIVGQSSFTGSRWPERLLLPAWSLSTEIVYYFIIGLITGTSKKLTSIAFLIALSIAVYLFYNDYPYQYFYFSIEGPALIFFTGAMFYYYRHFFEGHYLKSMWLLVFLTNLVIYVPDSIGLPRHNIPVLYITSFYLGYIVMCLHIISLQKPASRIEQFLADATYPMFLLHWAMGAIICYFVLEEYQRNLAVFSLAFPLTLMVSAAIVYAVEIPNKKIRRYFRQRAITADKT